MQFSDLRWPPDSHGCCSHVFIPPLPETNTQIQQNQPETNQQTENQNQKSITRLCIPLDDTDSYDWWVGLLIQTAGSDTCTVHLVRNQDGIRTSALEAVPHVCSWTQPIGVTTPLPYLLPGDLTSLLGFELIVEVPYTDPYIVVEVLYEPLGFPAIDDSFLFVDDDGAAVHFWSCDGIWGSPLSANRPTKNCFHLIPPMSQLIKATAKGNWDDTFRVKWNGWFVPPT